MKRLWPPFRMCAAAVVRAAGCLSVVMFSFAFAGCRSPAPEPEEPFRREHPPDVARSVSPTRSFDHRPYEFIWNPRPPSHIPLVDFDLLIGWTVLGGEGVEATFERSQEEQLWGGYTGRLHLETSGQEGLSVRVQPPEPARIPGRFDSVELWVYGPGTGCGPDPERTGPSLTLLLRDADDRPFRIPMGTLTWGGWQIVHCRVPDAGPDTVRHPVAFEGFLFEDLPAMEEAELFLDALSFYVEQLHPLKPEPRRARNLDPWPGVSPGLDRAEPALPVPVDPSTVLPPDPGDRVRMRVEEAGRHAYDFTAESDDWSLRYHVDLGEPSRAVRVFWNDVAVGAFADGGRVTGSQFTGGRLLLARLEGGRVRAEFEGGAVYRIGLSGRSLVVEAYSRASDADGFSLGHYEGPLRYTALDIPGLGTDAGAWAVVGALTGGDPSGVPVLFTSGVLDWYRSEASEIRMASPTGQPADTTLRTVYRPTTSGERNDLYERAMLTVSPRIEDVLPRLAQPVGQHADALTERIWADSDGPRDFHQALEASARLASYGLRDMVQGHGEACWRDGNESCTLRTRAAPARGGDDALAHMLNGQKALGWFVGLPSSYYGIHGLSPFWSSDLLQRETLGAWRRGPSGHYAVKAPCAVDLQRKVGLVLAGKFSPSIAFLTDVATHPPWTHTDYDARLPGAGRFGQAYYSAAELVLAEKEAFAGPVVCTGGSEAFYAGLADGYLAPSRPARPYFPVFYLARVNPLACGFGMGPFPAGIEDSGDADRFTDAGLADQIAYGRGGRLAPPALGIELQCRSYFMMRELQPRYLLRAPLRIAYWDGEGMVSTSEAIVGGALARSQLYLHYADDLEIWVNGSEDLDWEVRVGRDTWLLPPLGWVASAPDFLEVSALVDGRRMDYVKTPGFTYFDGRGRTAPFLGWTSSGPLAAWFHADAEPPMIEVLDIQGTGHLGLPHEGERLPQVEVFDLERSPVGRAAVTAEGARIMVRGPSGPHFYRILLEEQPVEEHPDPAVATAPELPEKP